MPHINNQQVNSLRINNQVEDDDKQIDVLTDDTSSNASDNEETSPKKSNFSISAILGLEKGDLKSAATACH